MTVLRVLALAVVMSAALSVVPVHAAEDGGSPSRCGDHPWCDTQLPASRRAELLLDALTLEQKFGLMSGDDPFGALSGDPATGTVDGIPGLDVPPVYMSDGPVGPREGRATAFPSPLALAASFRPELAHRVGRTIADEVRLKGNDVLHAPTVDVMRVPLAGRTFETYGEDPFLASALAPAWIRGAQSDGVIANVKHYLLNHQEGQVGVPPITSVLGARQLVNGIVDERTLWELYLPPFEASVVEADVGSVMCAYNALNHQPTCSSDFLLQQVLRDEWGFDGFVLTDYYLATKDTVHSVNNGTDIEMPIPQFYTPALLTLAVTSGLVTEATIDERVGNVLRTLFRFGFFDRAAFPSDESLIDRAGHAAVARENLEDGIVLLTNDGTLPLDAAGLSSIAVIGEPATSYVNGGGSSAVQPYAFTSALDGISDRAGADVNVTYDPGTDAAAAASTAATADVALVFVRDFATEGEDKTCLSLDCTEVFGIAGEQPQEELIRAVAAANPRTVVVMQTGGPVLTPWRGEVAAVVESWYPGQEFGPALARVLFGDVDPGGRLPVTFMEREEDTPVAGDVRRYPGVPAPVLGGPGQYTPTIAYEVTYAEGLSTGYRWHDANDVAPAFPFGFGLSYTSFALDDLEVRPDGDGATVHVTVRNTGDRRGWVVPQLYVRLSEPSPDVPMPVQQLRGFDKLSLAPGETQQVTMRIDRRALSYWSVADDGWALAPGCPVVRVGLHSRDPGMLEAPLPSCAPAPAPSPDVAPPSPAPAAPSDPPAAAPPLPATGGGFGLGLVVVAALTARAAGSGRSSRAPASSSRSRSHRGPPPATG